MRLVIPTIAFICGFVLGFTQSLGTGLVAKSWSGGTGILWGLIVGVVSALAAFWIGWQAIWVAFGISLVVFLASVFSIKKD